MATQAAERLDDHSVTLFSRSTKAAPKSPTDTDEIAVYLAKMTFELSAIARKANFDLLAYFLEMARIEANGQVAKSRGDLT